jgi:MFS transporter, PAT family, beta-lactamase induction signal transducer AmpG
VAITLDNVFSGFASVCLIVYMSGLTAKGFTATQYALFSSLYAIPGKILASQSGRIVEAAARNVESGGSLSIVHRLFTNLPPESFAKAYEKSGVSPAALASGYSIFFTYTCLVGLVAIVLTIAVMRREQPTTGT